MTKSRSKLDELQNQFSPEKATTMLSTLAANAILIENTLKRITVYIFF